MIEVTEAKEPTEVTKVNEITEAMSVNKTMVEMFPNADFPPGALVDYSTEYYARRKASKEELQSTENDEARLKDLRHAAEIHRQVRQMAQSKVQPGMRMVDICEMIEEGIRSLSTKGGFNGGIAFPVGCSLNHVAAHYNPNGGDDTVLRYEDICKIDIGVHVNGRIIDSAWTLSFDPRYDKLKEAVREATETGIRNAGIDVRLGELGGLIQETMHSYEVETKPGTMVPVKCIRNLNGHQIDQYHIHAGKTVPITRSSESARMAEGEQYAIETFGSTGKGWVNEEGECSHYMLNFERAPFLPDFLKRQRMPKPKALLETISRNFGTLAWCRRYLDRLGETKYLLALKSLVDQGIVDPYPPLADVKGSWTAQYEHTILLRPGCKEILSRGPDY